MGNTQRKQRQRHGKSKSTEIRAASEKDGRKKRDGSIQERGLYFIGVEKKGSAGSGTNKQPGSGVVRQRKLPQLVSP